MTPILAIAALLSAPPLVVIDPGHGGEAEGASGVCGVKEKEVVLDISLRLRDLLNASGRAQALLTRSTDHDVPLEARAHLANTRRAALLVSVHANAATKKTTRGVETFFLSRRAADRRITRLATRENGGRLPKIEPEKDELGKLLHNLRLNASHAESQRFAIRLQRSMHKHLKTEARGVLQAPFVVLDEAEVPAALVEVGFLTHPEECELLRSTEHQAVVAKTLASAIFAHLENESPLALAR